MRRGTNFAVGVSDEPRLAGQFNSCLAKRTSFVARFKRLLGLSVAAIVVFLGGIGVVPMICDSRGASLVVVAFVAVVTLVVQVQHVTFVVDGISE